MDSLRAIEYQNWLNDLKNTNGQNFSTEFHKFLHYLIKNNKTKTDKLVAIYNRESYEIIKLSESASEEIFPLFKKIKTALIKNKVPKPYPDIDLYEKALEVNTFYLGRMKVEMLYNSIRYTLERHVNDKSIDPKSFEDILSSHEGFYYIDSSKFTLKYPLYNISDKAIRDFDDSRSDKAWRSFAYLQFIDVNFGNSLSNDMGNAIKDSVISSLKTLIYYLVSTQSKKSISKPISTFQVKGLFSISKNPLAIQYEGVNAKKLSWTKVKGKTQTYALLKLVYEEFLRLKKRSGVDVDSVKISYLNVYECLTNLDNCDRPPRWDATDTYKRRLDLLKKNTIRILDFSNEEFSIQGNNSTVYTVFKRVRK